MKAKALVFSLFAVLIAVLSGCTTPVAIDPQTGREQMARYTAGNFYAPIEAESGAIFRAAIREMDNMGYFRTGEMHKDTYIAIYARAVGDKKVNVKITQVAPGQCELRIRVGALGDLPESQKIYAAIRDAL